MADGRTDRKPDPRSGLLRGLSYLRRLRLRVFAVIAAGAVATVGLVSFLALPPIPVVGVALITVAAVVNTMTSRLSTAVCWSCGEDLAGAKAGVHGVMCESCGAVNQQRA